MIKKITPLLLVMLLIGAGCSNAVNTNSEIQTNDTEETAVENSTVSWLTISNEEAQINNYDFVLSYPDTLMVNPENTTLAGGMAASIPLYTDEMYTTIGALFIVSGHFNEKTILGDEIHVSGYSARSMESVETFNNEQIDIPVYRLDILNEEGVPFARLMVAKSVENSESIFNTMLEQLELTKL